MRASFPHRLPGYEMQLCCSLLFFWLLGLIAGVWLSGVNSFFDYLVFPDICAIKPQFLNLTCISYLPIILCGVGMLLDSFFINASVVAILGICRGFCGFLLFVFFGSGAWLLRLMLVFSSAVSVVLVWWLLLRYYVCGKSSMPNDICISAIVMFLFILGDQLLISPFLIQLSMYF